MICYVCQKPILWGEPTARIDINVGACAVGAGNWKEIHSQCCRGWVLPFGNIVFNAPAKDKPMGNPGEMECKIVEADFNTDRVTLEMKHPYRVGGGRYWLLTDDAYDKLCTANDPKPLG